MAWFRRDKETLPGQHVPGFVICAAIFLIPITVAVVNYFMVISDLQLIAWKFSATQDMMAKAGVGPGTAVLVGFSVACASVAAALVSMVAPICAGSGIPEVLGFLNGNSQPDLFTLRGFCVRTAAIVLVQAAGFPVGREGPMVAIGGTVGFGVAWLLLRPQERRWEEVVASPGLSADSIKLNSTTLSVNQERFAHVKRVGCALGGAAGIATAFNAPIGGILYMFEELAVSSLPPHLARFMCTVFASLMARVLLQITNLDVHRLVIYEENASNSQGGWAWADLLLLILLAAVLGCVGSLFSRLLLASWSFRRKVASRLSAYQPWAKIIDCTAYCIICSLMWGLMPALFECRPISSAGDAADGDGHHRLLSSDTHLNFVQYACPDGHYNEVATYLLSGPEGAVKHLYSQDGEVQRSGPLAATLVCYFALACGMPGLSVPMGTFVPSMLTGALVGRLFGENINLLMTNLGGPSLASAGFYAVVGSASMLAGLTHMTVGIVALLAEAIGDFGFIAPLMLSVFVAETTAKFFSSFGYDEHLIIMKGIPFLDPEMRKEMEAGGLTAKDISEVLPDEAVLPPKATMMAIKRALRQRQIQYFPIIAEGSICIGLTTRGRLRAVLEAVSQHPHHGARPAMRRPSVDSSNSANSEGTTSVGSSNDADNSSRTSPEVDLASAVNRDSVQSSRRRSSGHLLDVQAEAKLKHYIKVMFASSKGNVEDGDCARDAQHLLPIDRIMDPAPHALPEDMPVSRFYDLFNKTGAHVAVVISKRGRFRGILTRAGLIKAQTKLHADPQKGGGCDSKEQAPGLADQLPAFDRSISTESSRSKISAEYITSLQRGAGQINPVGIDSIVNAVVGNMRPEELQGELKKAWTRAAEEAESLDDLRDSLKAADRRIKELELQHFGTVTHRSTAANFSKPPIDLECYTL